MFYAEVLYPEEFAKDPTLAYRRMIIAAPESSGKEEIRRAIIEKAKDSFNAFSNHYPFTAYSVAESEMGDIHNWSAQAGQNYFDEIGRKGGAVRQEISIPMVTFFAKPDDYWLARSRILQATAVLTRLDVPILLNKVAQDERPGSSYQIDTRFTVDLEATVSKGEFAGEFEQYLQENKIWNIKHDVKVKYYDFSFSTYIGDMSVQEMAVRLRSITDDGLNPVIYEFLAPDECKLLSTSPADKATDVPTTVPMLQFTFNTPMKENDTEFLITFNPVIEAEWGWSSDSKILTFYPFVPLQANTKYTIDVPETVQDMWTHTPESAVEITFLTGV